MGKNYLTVVYETDEKTSVQKILNAHPWALCSHTHAVYELAAARLEIAKLKTQLEAVGADPDDEAVPANAAESYTQRVIEALYENGDPVSVDAAEELQRLAAQLEAVGAGGVDGDVDAVALARYKVAPAHESMFHRFAVVAGDGKQQLYLGRKNECQNMARKFAGAFLDGAFYYQSNIAPTPPAQAQDARKPLTCAEVQKIVIEVCDAIYPQHAVSYSEADTVFCGAFVRAIEAAHGIAAQQGTTDD